MAEISDLEKEYDYTIEYDDGSEFVHLYFANILDFESPAYVRFDPLYELGDKVDRKVEDETVMIPYGRLIRIIKRKPV